MIMGINRDSAFNQSIKGNHVMNCQVKIQKPLLLFFYSQMEVKWKNDAMCYSIEIMVDNGSLSQYRIIISRNFHCQMPTPFLL